MFIFEDAIENNINSSKNQVLTLDFKQPNYETKMQEKL